MARLSGFIKRTGGFGSLEGLVNPRKAHIQINGTGYDNPIHHKPKARSVLRTKNVATNGGVMPKLPTKNINDFCCSKNLSKSKHPNLTKIFK